MKNLHSGFRISDNLKGIKPSQTYFRFWKIKNQNNEKIIVTSDTHALGQYFTCVKLYDPFGYRVTENEGV